MRPLLVFLTAIAPSLANAGVDVTAGAELSYDDNLYLLSESQATELDERTSNNDRYDDMESSADLIVGAGVRLDYKTKELAGRSTRFRLEPAVSVHLRNSRNTWAAIAGGVDQRLWKGGGVYLRARLAPSRYKKNYFDDGVDTNGNGVSGSEKDYEPGVVTDAGGVLGVRSDVGKRVELHLEGGAGVETWAAPFVNRNERALFVETGASVKLAKRVKLGVSYEGVSAATGDDDEVVITDRQRLVMPVDRSYTSARMAASLGVEVAKHLDARVTASLRGRGYTSDGETDPYKDRVDRRTAFALSVKYGLKDLDVGASAENTSNRTKRPNDPDRSNDEELDYTRNVFSLFASYRF